MAMNFGTTVINFPSITLIAAKPLLKRSAVPTSVVAMKSFRFLLTTYILALPAAWSQVANIIPAAERIDWTVGTNVGVRGGIPTNRTQYGSTIAAGASSATINAALVACPTNQYVLLGPGDFTITTALSVPSNVTLKGSGVGVTRLHSTTGTMVSMGNGTDWGGGDINITAGYTKGSTNITLASSLGLPVGDVIDITQDNESWVWLAAQDSGAVNCINSVHRVEAGSSGTSVNIWPPLAYGSTGHNPKIKKQSYSVTHRPAMGLEDISFYSCAAITDTIVVSGSYGSWIKNCDMYSYGGFGILVSDSCGLEITHVDFHGWDATLQGEGGAIIFINNYGGNTACTVYNCYSENGWVLVLDEGSVGNVYAYNFTHNEHSTPLNNSTSTAGFNVSHEAEGLFNLWEGNYSHRIVCDAIHGGAAFQTIWRCRFHGQEDMFPGQHANMIELMQGAYWFHVVGCVLGDTWSESNQGTLVYYAPTPAQWNTGSYQDGYGAIWLTGLIDGSTPYDALTVNTLRRYNNYDYYHQAAQDTGSYTVDNSLAWASKPAWFGNLAWPAYDPANPLVYGDAAASRIPAGYRYINGIDPPGVGTPQPPGHAHAAFAPTIVTQPSSLSVAAGASAVFSVSVFGTTPLSYQWYKDGRNISNATGATFAIASAQASDAGAYTVAISNGFGSVTSATATLAVQ